MSKKDVELLYTQEIFEKLGIRPRHSGRVYDTSKEELPTVPFYIPHVSGRFKIDDQIKIMKESERMKFKVGDKVVGDHGEFAPWNRDTHGKQGEIIATNLVEIRLEDGKEIVINQGNLKLLQSAEPTPKSLLKDGVVAILRNGQRGVIIGEMFLYEHGNTPRRHINFYNKDLDFELGKDEDIMKLEFDGKVIWKRPKAIKYEVTGYKNSASGVTANEFTCDDEERLIGNIKSMIKNEAYSSFEVHKRSE